MRYREANSESFLTVDVYRGVFRYKYVDRDTTTDTDHITNNFFAYFAIAKLKYWIFNLCTHKSPPIINTSPFKLYRLRFLWHMSPRRPTHSHHRVEEDESRIHCDKPDTSTGCPLFATFTYHSPRIVAHLPLYRGGLSSGFSLLCTTAPPCRRSS